MRATALLSILALIPACASHREPSKPPLESLENRYVQLEFVIEHSDLRRLVVLKVAHVDPPFLEGAIVREWREVDPGEWVDAPIPATVEPARLDTSAATHWQVVEKPPEENPANEARKERVRTCLAGAGLFLCVGFLGVRPPSRGW